MRATARTAALAGVLVVGLTVAAVPSAQAATVDRSEFRKELRAAVNKAWKTPAGRATANDLYVKTSGPNGTTVSYGSSVVNPDGSFTFSPLTPDGTPAVLTSCPPAPGACSATTDNGTTWAPAPRPDPNTFNVPAYPALRKGATFSVHRGKFTMVNEKSGVTTKVRVKGHTVTIVTLRVNPSTGVTTRRVLTHQALAPADVQGPAS
jgi:hypothetical protein